MNQHFVKNRSHRSISPNGTLSLLFSLVIHLAIVLVLACWMVVAGNPNGEFSLLLQGESDAELASLRLTQEVAIESSSENSSVSLASLDKPSAAELQLSIEPTEITLDEDVSTLPYKFSLASTAPRSTAEAMEPGESDNGREGQGATFFGAYASGNRFVYVLDSSSSMEGVRWLLARQKLIQSLRQLGPEREFYLICFDHETTFMFGNPPSMIKFEKANSSTIQKVERWLRYRQLGSSTMPAEALQYAINMKPDAIFLLSDGELRDNSLFMLRMINAGRQDHRQVPIHTVHLLSPVGRATLEVIAKENGGTFSLVDEPSDFNRRLR